MIKNEFPLTIQWLKYQFEALSSYRLILPDLRGYDQSDYDFPAIYKTYPQQDLHKYINLGENNEETEVYQHLYSMMASTKDQGAVASHIGRASRRDHMDYLPFIKTPTLVISGEKDFFLSIEAAKQVADHIPMAQFHIIEKAGHLPNMKQPEVFNQLLVQFYQEIIPSNL